MTRFQDPRAAALTQQIDQINGIILHRGDKSDRY